METQRSTREMGAGGSRGGDDGRLASASIGRYLVVATVLLLVAGSVAVATTPFQASDVLGPAGDPIDETLAGVEGRVADLVAGIDSTGLGGDGGSNATSASDGESTGSNATMGRANGTARASGTGLDALAVETWIHRFVNRERAERGLGRLERSQPLHEAALIHSRDMARDDYVAHRAPDGGTFADRYERVGFECRVPVGENRYATGGENIAYTYFDAQVRLDNGSVVVYDTPRELARGIVTGWMRSPGHRRNLLAERWGREGIGVVAEESPRGVRVYATQNFC